MIADNFGFPGGSIIRTQSIGLATDTTINNGIMGVNCNDGTHPSVVRRMVLQDLINSQAYSIYLDDLETSSGEILFGGIGTQKFVGLLKTLALN